MKYWKKFLNYHVAYLTVLQLFLWKTKYKIVLWRRENNKIKVWWKTDVLVSKWIKLTLVLPSVQWFLWKSLALKNVQCVIFSTQILSSLIAAIKKFCLIGNQTGKILLHTCSGMQDEVWGWWVWCQSGYTVDWIE